MPRQRKPIAPILAFLIAKRKDKGWSQRDLERNGGPSQPLQSQLENGVQSASIETLQKYATGLYMNLALVDQKGQVHEFPDVE